MTGEHIVYLQQYDHTDLFDRLGVDVEELEAVIEYDYTPFEPMEAFYPGCDEATDIVSIRVRLPGGDVWLDPCDWMFDDRDMYDMFCQARYLEDSRGF